MNDKVAKRLKMGFFVLTHKFGNYMYVIFSMEKWCVGVKRRCTEKLMVQGLIAAIISRQ